MSNLSDNELLNYATTLASKLADNVKYKDLQPPVAEAQPTITAFGQAVAHATKGSQTERLARDQLRGQVEDILDRWSAYATQQTPGDVVL